MQVARRITLVVGLVALIGCFTLALMPVTFAVPFGTSTGCNASDIAGASSKSTSGLSTFESAIVVWINPATVKPPDTDGTTDRGQATAAGYEAICRHAAQNQMIPAVVLFAAALFLLTFGRPIVLYISTGLDRRSNRVRAA